MTANVTEVIDRIEAELDRLEANDSETNCSGIGVYADDDLPEGWVRLSDGGATVYGPATKVLEKLQDAELDDEDDDEGEPSGWHSAWAALNEFPTVNPTEDSYAAGKARAAWGLPGEHVYDCDCPQCSAKSEE